MSILNAFFDSVRYTLKTDIIRDLQAGTTQITVPIDAGSFVKIYTMGWNVLETDTRYGSTFRKSIINGKNNVDIKQLSKLISYFAFPQFDLHLLEMIPFAFKFSIKHYSLVSPILSTDFSLEGSGIGGYPYRKLDKNKDILYTDLLADILLVTNTREELSYSLLDYGSGLFANVLTLKKIRPGVFVINNSIGVMPIFDVNLLMRFKLEDLASDCILLKDVLLENPVNKTGR